MSKMKLVILFEYWGTILKG